MCIRPPFSKSFGKTAGNEAARSLRARCSVSANTFLFLGIDFVYSSSLVSLNRCHDLQIKGERYKVEILLTISVFFYERTSIVNRDENIFKYTHTCIYMFIFENDEIASKFAFSGSMMFYRKDREVIVTRISAVRRTCARGQARRDETRRETRREAAKVKESGELLMMHGHGHRRILDTNVTPVSSIKLRDRLRLRLRLNIPDDRERGSASLIRRPRLFPLTGIISHRLLFFLSFRYVSSPLFLTGPPGPESLTCRRRDSCGLSVE